MAAHKLKALAGFLPLGDWMFVSTSIATNFGMAGKDGATYTVSKDCVERVEKKEEVKSGLFSKDIIFEVHFTNGQSAIFKADEKAFTTIYEAQFTSKKVPTQIIETKPSKGMVYACVAICVLMVWGMFSCSSSNKERQASEQNVEPFKTFTEKDFYFTKKEKPYKDLIIRGVNKVHREHAGCKTIDPASASLAKEKGTKANPTFFVTCGENTGVFNVYFSKADIEKNAALRAPRHISHDEAQTLCKNAALASTTHPSSVDFGRLLDLTDHPNGNTSVSYFFEAKNSFGLELKFRIDCLINADGLVQEPSITEVAN